MGNDTVVDMAAAPEELKVPATPSKTRVTPSARTVCGKPLWAAAVATALCMGVIAGAGTGAFFFIES